MANAVLTYRTVYGYAWRWAILAELFWRIEHSWPGRLRRWGYRMRKACEHRAAGSRTLQHNALNLDGWCVSICPGCGTQVAEWLDEDGGPGHVEHEFCPMCDEADRTDSEGMGWL